MATPRVTIDQLPETVTPADTQLFVVQDAGTSKKMSYATLKAQTSTPLANHIADTDDAHDASAISATDSGGGINGTNVQAQLGQLATLTNTKISQIVADGLYVNLGGDTMTGPLILVTDPTGALEAATKQYVDSKVIEAGGGISMGEADARYVNIDGDTMSGALSVDALITTNTGLVLPVGEPSALDRACRKDYVDAQVATRLTQAQGDARYLQPGAADTGYVNVSGDAMTGALSIIAPIEALKLMRGDGANNPVMGFYNSDGVARQAYIQSFSGNLRLATELANGAIQFYTGSPSAMRGWIGASRLHSIVPIWSDSTMRALTGSLLYGTGNVASLHFHHQATDAETIGTRGGYVGMTAASIMGLATEVTNGVIRLLTPGSAGAIEFWLNGALQGRWDAAGNLMTNKTATALTSIGAELQQSGRIYSVTDTNVCLNLVTNITNGASGDVFASWRRANVDIGHVNQTGTTGVIYATSSDGRMKHEIGEVTEQEALDRVMAYRPVKYQWLLDVNQSPSVYGRPGGRVEWGMIAQEAIEVNDVAVGPSKHEPGDVDFQPMAMDYGRITPELVAAIQALVRRVEALEGAAA